MEVTALCSKFIQKFHVSVANVVQMRPLDFIMKEKTKFALVGNNMVTLKEFEKQEEAAERARSAETATVPCAAHCPPPSPSPASPSPASRTPSASPCCCRRAQTWSSPS